MKKNIIFIYILLMASFILQAQDPQVHQAEHFILSEAPTSGSHIYEARDYVEFVNGFDYTAESNFIETRINPLLEFPPNTGITDPDPNSDGGVVGVIAGQHGVSPSGGATYTIPLFCPPGINGMQPNLSLVYNSQGGNGVLGFGWSISGLSTITRIPKTIFHDNEVDPVKLDYTDNFALNGNRLILKSGTYGQNATYSTEIETFSRITSYYNAYNIQTWFKVENKDGTTIEYGNTMYSKYLTEDGDKAILWQINKIYDRSGNSIEFEYIISNREQRISKIKYTENNTGTAYVNEILFVYETSDRPDIQSGYIAGSNVKQIKLLDRVEISTNGIVIKTYDLTYKTNLYSFLEKITEKGRNNDIYNSTRFLYNENTNNEIEIDVIDRTGLPLGGQTGRNMVFYPGDFNGDGLTDLLGLYYQFEDEDEDNARFAWSYIYLNKNKGITSGFEEHQISISFGFYGDEYLQFNKGDYFPIYGTKILIGDMNGDSKDDIIYGKIDSYDVGLEKNINYQAWLSTPTSTGYSFEKSNTIIESENYMESSDKYNLHVSTLADFDGDGRQEFFCMNTRSFDITITSFDDRINESIPKGNNYEEISNPSLTTIDYDGDGQTELILTYPEGIWVIKQHIDIELKETGIVQDWHQDIISGITNILSGDNNYATTKIVDFNGDGLQDKFEVQEDDNIISGSYFLISKGNSSGESFSITSFLEFENTNSSFESEYALFRDINGDGKTDIIIPQGKTLPINTIKIYYATGEPGVFEEVIKDLNFVWDDNTSFDFGDFDGDGNTELIAKNTDWCCLSIIGLNPAMGNMERPINTITDGFSNEIKFAYNTPTQEVNYTHTNNYSYPLNEIQMAVAVVSNVTVSNGFGGTLENTYEYEGAVVHMQGKGFLGFQKFTTTNTLTNLSSKINYAIDNSIFLPYISSSETKINGNYLLHTDNSFIIHDYQNGCYFPYIEKSNTRKWDLNGSFISTTQQIVNYNSTDILYGNPTWTASLSDPNALLPSQTNYFDFVQCTDYSYLDADETNWVINRPFIVTNLLKSPGKPDIQNEQKFSYYSDTRYPFIHTITNNESNPLGLATKTTLDYDSYGNVISKTISAPDQSTTCPDRTSSFLYDETYHHRFIARTTNNLGHFSEIEYDNLFGNVTKKTDANGLVSRMEYDAFGRLKKTIHSDNTVSVQVLRWVIDGDCPGRSDAVYYSWSQNPALPPVKTFYDRLGRKIRTSSKAFNGETICVDTHYDAEGRFEKTSNPYFYGADPKYTEITTYDELNRKKLITLPDNSTITYTYEGRTNKVKNSLNQESAKTVNAAGWLINSKAPDGKSVVYTHFSDGNVETTAISGVSGTAISNQYDINGNVTLLSDPNFGTINYTYNAFGELTYKKDQKDQEINYTYDALGRLETEVSSEGTITNNYDTKANGLGNISYIESSANGHRIEYWYDEQGRTTKETETIDGTNYTYEYSYDDFGRQKEMIYPSSSGWFPLTIGYKYKNGMLEKIINKENNLCLWQTNIVNSQGQITNHSINNNMLVTGKEYYPLTHLLKSIKTGNATNPTSIQDLEYLWDDIGNLTWRKNHNLKTALNVSYIEEFTYDPMLNRLDIIKLNGTKTQNMDYDIQGLGNIVMKEDVGDYTYNENGAGLHAVTSLTNLTGMGNINTGSQTLTYTSFDKFNNITEEIDNDTYTLDVDYGFHKQRIKQVFKINDQEQKTKIFAGSDYETISDASGITEYHYISGTEGTFAIYDRKPDGSVELNYLHPDHLGSVHQITNQQGVSLQELSFDAWGNRRDPATWETFTTTPVAIKFDRGFTFHEHLPEFGLINMNGRVYDPIIARFLSPDPFVQAPELTQNLNRYSYVLNNPLRYTDPDGEFIIEALIIYALFFTETGYDIQKYLSPVAFHVDVKFGTHQRGIGIDASVGVPQIMPTSIRAHGGISYYSRNYNITPGWETRFGGEIGITPYVVVGFTQYDSPGNKFDQRLAHVRLGVPGLNYKYANDWFFGLPLGDGGDRYRTGAAKLQLGPIHVGINFFTGDPGVDNRQKQMVNGHLTYVYNPATGKDPDEFRAGVGYIAIGPFRFGNDRESRRHNIQNKLLHDWIGSPYFKKLNLPNKWYFQFGGGSGLW